MAKFLKATVNGSSELHTPEDPNVMADIFLDDHPLAGLNNRRLTTLSVAELEKFQQIFVQELQERFSVVLGLLGPAAPRLSDEDIEEISSHLAAASVMQDLFGKLASLRKETMCPEDKDLHEHLAGKAFDMGASYDGEGKPIIN